MIRTLWVSYGDILWGFPDSRRISENSVPYFLHPTILDLIEWDNIQEWFFRSVFFKCWLITGSMPPRCDRQKCARYFSASIFGIDGKRYRIVSRYVFSSHADHSFERQVVFFIAIICFVPPLWFYLVHLQVAWPESIRAGTIRNDLVALLKTRSRCYGERSWSLPVHSRR